MLFYTDCLCLALSRFGRFCNKTDRSFNCILSMNLRVVAISFEFEIYVG